MNTVKIFRNKGGVVETRHVKTTQSTNHTQKSKLPYAHEVYSWAEAHGWWLTKREAELDA